MRRPPTLPPMPKREILATEPVLPSTPAVRPLIECGPCGAIFRAPVGVDYGQLFETKCPDCEHEGVFEPDDLRWPSTPELDAVSVPTASLPEAPPAELCPIHNASECYCVARPGEVWEAESNVFVGPARKLGPDHFVGTQRVTVGVPDDDHDCDQMGCGSGCGSVGDHVISREIVDPRRLPHELPSMPDGLPRHKIPGLEDFVAGLDLGETENVQVTPPPVVVGPGPTSTLGAVAELRERLAGLGVAIEVDGYNAAIDAKNAEVAAHNAANAERERLLEERVAALDGEVAEIARNTAHAAHEDETEELRKRVAALEARVAEAEGCVEQLATEVQAYGRAVRAAKPDTGIDGPIADLAAVMEREAECQAVCKYLLTRGSFEATIMAAEIGAGRHRS